MLNSKTFSYRVKSEILSYPDKYIAYGAIFEKRELSFKNKAILRYVYSLLKWDNQNIKLSIHGNKNLLKGEIFRKLPSTEEQKINFLKGVILSKGYISDPKKRHSLDIEVENSEYIERLFGDLDLKVKVYSGGKSRVSSRSSENIRAILLGLRLMESYFYYEDVVILNRYRLENNRAINLQIANDIRQEISRHNQLKIIDLLEKNGIFKELDSNLMLLIEYIRRYKEESSYSIAKRLSISKSSFNRRFKIIEGIYKKVII